MISCLQKMLFSIDIFCEKLFCCQILSLMLNYISLSFFGSYTSLVYYVGFKSVNVWWVFVIQHLLLQVMVCHGKHLLVLLCFMFWSIFSVQLKLRSKEFLLNILGSLLDFSSVFDGFRMQLLVTMHVH